MGGGFMGGHERVGYTRLTEIWDSYTFGKTGAISPKSDEDGALLKASRWSKVTSKLTKISR